MTEGLTAEAVLARHTHAISDYCTWAIGFSGKPWPWPCDAVQLARQLLAAQERVAALENDKRGLVHVEGQKYRMAAWVHEMWPEWAAEWEAKINEERAAEHTETPEPQCCNEKGGAWCRDTTGLDHCNYWRKSRGL